MTLSNRWFNIVGIGRLLARQCLCSVKSSRISKLSLIYIWNKEVFVNVHELVSLAVNNLYLIQIQIDIDGHTDELLNQQKEAQITLDQALTKEETFWKEKADVRWHLEGDRDNSYFHRISKIKAKTNQITSCFSLSQSKFPLISLTIWFFFCTSSFLQVISLVDEVIPKLITDPTNTMLTTLTSIDEIHHVVFALNSNGAPSPDGFGEVFFQTFWNIVKIDVENAVLQFFNKSWMLPNFNANTLVLIPKSQNVDSVSQYMPIALENFKYKIISKIFFLKKLN